MEWAGCLILWTWRNWQGISPIAKIATAISTPIFLKIETAIAIVIWKKIDDLERDRSMPIADLYFGDLFMFFNFTLYKPFIYFWCIYISNKFSDYNEKPSLKFLENTKIFSWKWPNFEKLTALAIAKKIAIFAIAIILRSCDQMDCRSLMPLELECFLFHNF